MAKSSTKLRILKKIGSGLAEHDDERAHVLLVCHALNNALH